MMTDRLSDLADRPALASQRDNIHVLLLGQHNRRVPPVTRGLGSPEAGRDPPTVVDSPLEKPFKLRSNANFADHLSRNSLIADNVGNLHGLLLVDAARRLDELVSGTAIYRPAAPRRKAVLLLPAVREAGHERSSHPFERHVPDTLVKKDRRLA